MLAAAGQRPPEVAAGTGRVPSASKSNLPLRWALQAACEDRAGAGYVGVTCKCFRKVSHCLRKETNQRVSNGRTGAVFQRELPAICGASCRPCPLGPCSELARSVRAVAAAPRGARGAAGCTHAASLASSGQ